MKQTRSIVDQLLPWGGTIGALLGWGGSHQIGSDTVFESCAVGDAVTLVASAAGLLVALIGGVMSFAVWAGSERSDGRNFAAVVSMLLAGLASFAIVLQIVAPLILTPCAG